MERGGRPGLLCRNFARGSCRWGQHCRFAHDGKSGRPCRYFQSGLCSYGERCGYRHVQEEPGGSRAEPEPGGSRGAEPPWPPRGRPAAALVTFRLPSARAAREDKEEEKEEEENGRPAPENPPGRGAGAGEPVPAQDAAGSAAAVPGRRPSPSGAREVEVAPRARHAESDAERRARSAAVACGICMERVYEKALPEERLFGILPNCGHAFCLGCIRQWRRSRDFEASIIKACPECRVTSSYYIPHKYWVTDADEKGKLIETFKARTGKIRCKFFVRNRGHCPFKSDCIYLHELPAGWTSRHRRRRRPQRRVLEVDPFLLESSDEEEEDEELCALEWALTWALMDAETRESTYRLFMDLSDSD